MGKFHEFLTELSAYYTSILSNCQWIFTKLGMCIDIVETWFGIAIVKILSIFDRVMSIFLLSANNLSKCQWIFTKLGSCIDIVFICFWIADGQISSIFDSYLSATCHILISGG